MSRAHTTAAGGGVLGGMAVSNLLSLLDLGAAGIAAQNAGVAVAGNNTANVNTRGYSRQRVDLHAGLAAPLVGGVRSGSAQRYQSNLLSARERISRGSSGHSGARASALLDLQSAVVGGGGIEDSIASLWAGLQRVSSMPTDSMVRQAAINAASDLAEGIAERAAAVAQARADADARIRDAAEQATALAQQIADANKAIGTGGGGGDPVAEDNRDEAARQLSDLVGGEGRIDADGQMRWVLPDGGVLVDGDQASTLQATPDAATGFNKVELVTGNQRRDVTASLDSGSIGGDLSFRDGDARQSADQLDQLAFDFTRAVNAVHSANAGEDGVAGRNLFVAQAGVAGAASRMAVDPALLADPTRLAVAAPGAGIGDNQGVNALLALSDQKVASGGTRTLGDAAIAIGNDLGHAASEAKSASARDGEVADHLASLRDSLSGVDIDEEMSKMVQFQHASEAMTRFVSTVDGMLGDLLDRL
ncbi:MAG TPA: flagellar hook-associated protein FlgK [Kofleriaceae bacterium]|nr:flagellar hook-associated protein FlgK [Kofleriaceae bacterium]